MNKAQLVDAIASGPKMTKTDASKALDAVFTAIGEALNKGERISIRGFGSFYVAERKARMGRNPRTGEVINIKAKSVVKFRPRLLPFPPEGWQS